jgi:hypothetical protein
LDLADVERQTKEAVMTFWGNRDKARQKKLKAKKIDQGQRGSATSGKNMDGFATLILDLVKANGLSEATIHRRKSLVTLPGFFRPTKQWDLVIVDNNRLVAALELKSQVGPSFSNNCNNRAEEAIGSAYDFRVAFDKGAFGDHPRPFLGWMVLVEDAPASRCPVKHLSPHFRVFPEFKNASYLKRYELLCQRLEKDLLYTATCVMASPKQARKTGEYSDLSTMTSFRNFITALAGRIAIEAARKA